MLTFRELPYEREADLPPAIADDVQMPESFVRHFLDEHTDPGDRVLDPFAGFGTTLRVAEDLDRVPYGVEYEQERADYIHEVVDHSAHLRQGDVRDVDLADLPPMDCVLTSPPFMVQGMTTNPFQNYDGESDYGTYLGDLRTAFERVETTLAADATVLVDVVNVKYEREVTPLAWDAAEAIDEVLDFRGEVVVTWTETEDGRDGRFGFGYDHSYCLVFDAA